ncbi:unnamed protein product [Calypogeia fissa]
MSSLSCIELQGAASCSYSLDVLNSETRNTSTRATTSTSLQSNKFSSRLGSLRHSSLKWKPNSRSLSPPIRTRRQIMDGAAEVVKVQSPPSDYDFRAEIMDETVRVIGSTYPDLMDLVEDGTLVVVLRSSDYVERRSDSYREPEMVFVVGTAHMSLRSAFQVERVIRAVRPQNVVVELCRSRAGIMYPSEDKEEEKDEEIRAESTQNGQTQNQTKKKQRNNLMSLSGENFGAAMSRSLRLGGRSALALRLLLGGMSEKLSKSTGIASGEEFRAARKAAEEIGAQLVLGDRPIEVTLKRAWEALNWNERFRLAAMFFQAMNSSLLDDLAISEDMIQILKSDDALSQMFAEMGSRLPSLLQPLIYERDMYLAWSLKRSKAVNGCSRVVGVVGKGHMRGVVFNLKHNQENLRFRDLVGPRSSRNPEDGNGNPLERPQMLLQEFIKRFFKESAS